MLEFKETYRGQDIYIDWTRIYNYEDAYWTELLDPNWYPSVTAIKNAIDEALEEPTPPPPPPPPPPPTPPEEEPEYIETYRGVDIYYDPNLGFYTAQVAVGFMASGFTVEDCRASIDEILEFLEPPEEPPDGLFAQVVAAVKAWFLENIGYHLQPVYDFIDEMLAGARAAWEKMVADTQDWWGDIQAETGAYLVELDGRWDNFATVTLPDIWTTITERVGQVADALDQAKIDINASLTTALSDHWDAIQNLLTLMDPMGFLEDPVKHIKAVFSIQRQIAETAIIKSFWEGFEEGLAE